MGFGFGKVYATPQDAAKAVLREWLLDPLRTTTTSDVVRDLWEGWLPPRPTEEGQETLNREGWEEVYREVVEKTKKDPQWLFGW